MKQTFPTALLLILSCGAPSDLHQHGHDKYAHCAFNVTHAKSAMDGTFADAPVEISVGSSKDTQMPKAMSDWMFEQGWHQQHDDWHNIRRWDQNCRLSNAPAKDCKYATRLVNKGLWRAAIQEGAPGDGYDFLAMHRHMIQMLRQTFPSAKSLLSGFQRVPFSQSDALNPQPWQNIRWSEGQLKAIDTLENIEQHLEQFATEDDLALFMEAPFRWTPVRPNEARGDNSGIHFSLHAQWSVAGSPVALGNGLVTIDNTVFWKLHGWLDDVWARFRKARGIDASDAKYQAAIEAQCREMVDLDELNLTPVAQPPLSPAQPAAESGFFAERVRPIFDAKCEGCHNAVSQQVGLALGGQGLSSLDVVNGLKGKLSSNGLLQLVKPGVPEESWLYLKMSPELGSASCGGACNRGPMPPAGVMVTAEELSVVRQWIVDGAPSPMSK